MACSPARQWERAQKQGTRPIHIQLVNKCNLKFWIIRKQYKTEGRATEQRQFVNVGTWKPHQLVKIMWSLWVSLWHIITQYSMAMSMFIRRSNLKSSMKSERKHLTQIPEVTVQEQHKSEQGSLGQVLGGLTFKGLKGSSLGWLRNIVPWLGC